MHSESTRDLGKQDTMSEKEQNKIKKIVETESQSLNISELPGPDYKPAKLNV